MQECRRCGFDLLEESMATHSSILAWRIPGTEEPGGYSSCGLEELGTIEVTYHECTPQLAKVLCLRRCVLNILGLVFSWFHLCPRISPYVLPQILTCVGPILTRSGYTLFLNDLALTTVFAVLSLLFFQGSGSYSETSFYVPNHLTG